jgi:hypothetical protein
MDLIGLNPSECKAFNEFWLQLWPEKNVLAEGNIAPVGKKTGAALEFQRPGLSRDDDFSVKKS